MYKWIQGTQLHPQGRAIVYGAIFREETKRLADLSYFEHPQIGVLADRAIEGVFHTFESREGVQKLGIPPEMIKEGLSQATPQMHALAEMHGLRTISFLPSFTFQIPCALEGALPVTPHEDVIFVGSYHNPLHLHEAVLAGSTLYHTGLSESLERAGTLEQRVHRIPHTFQAQCVADLSEGQLLVPYLTNRFLVPLAGAGGNTALLRELHDELVAFGEGTALEEPFHQLYEAFTRPACRPDHVAEFRAAHMALVHYVAEEAYEKAREAQTLINDMRV